MKQPSSEWLNSLILIIQEAPTEVGMDFNQWLGYDDWDYLDNDQLIKKLKQLKD